VVKLEKVDVRRWEAGETTTVKALVRMPASVAAGTYKLALWLPDEVPALQADARYAIRLANDGLWDATTGDNLLSEKLVVDPAAGGDVDASASELAVLE
jgi:Domain of unknown function (DUF4832)